MCDEFQWRSEFETGVEEIDLQHHYFVNLINRLSKSLTTRDHDPAQNRLLNELMKFAQFHFASEENLMSSLNYADLEEHKRLHIKLLNTLNGRIGLFQQDLAEADQLLEFLREWFLNHILVEDKKLTAYLKSSTDEN
jgi:hemerythrin